MRWNHDLCMNGLAKTTIHTTRKNTLVSSMEYAKIIMVFLEMLHVLCFNFNNWYFYFISSKIILLRNIRNNFAYYVIGHKYIPYEHKPNRNCVQIRSYCVMFRGNFFRLFSVLCKQYKNEFDFIFVTIKYLIVLLMWLVG